MHNILNRKVLYVVRRFTYIAAALFTHTNSQSYLPFPVCMCVVVCVCTCMCVRTVFHDINRTLTLVNYTIPAIFRTIYSFAYQSKLLYTDRDNIHVISIIRFVCVRVCACVCECFRVFVLACVPST